MQPVLQFKSLTATVKVYSDRFLIEPSDEQPFGKNNIKREILFCDISSIDLKKESFMSAGALTIYVSSAANSSAAKSNQGEVTGHVFKFRRGWNEKVAEIRKYVEENRLPGKADIENGLMPSTLLLSSGEELQATRTPLPSQPESFNKYRELTASRNWQGIFQFNNSQIDNFGTKKELGILHNYLSEGEVVFALASGILSQTVTSNTLDFGTNTWLAVLTDRRVIFLDHAMLSESVDTQSIRHDKIQAVSASQGWMFGSITIDIGSRSILVDNCDKTHVRIFAELANNWLEYRENQNDRSQPSTSDPIAALSQLAELRSAGVLNDDEFAAAKAKIIGKL